MTLRKPVGQPVQFQRMRHAVCRPIGLVAFGTVERRLGSRRQHAIGKPAVLIMQDAELDGALLAVDRPA